MFKRFPEIGEHWSDSEGEVLNAKGMEVGVEMAGGMFFERFVCVA